MSETPTSNHQDRPIRAQAPSASVIVPAHNEARTIARTLGCLLRDALPGEFDIVVVCNGCSDATAAIARGFPSVRVLELRDASKSAAVRRGNKESDILPRIHLDADVEIDADGIRALVLALRPEGIQAVGPRRVISRTAVSKIVRIYYDVWEALPQVRCGLFGRGVIGLSEAGQARVDSLPEMMSDDLAISDAFANEERLVVARATVLIRPPRTVEDLLRRRTRIAIGNTQADDAGIRRIQSRTSPKTLARVIAGRPTLILGIPVFIAITIVARIRARRAVHNNDHTTWHRDDSSRT